MQRYNILMMGKQASGKGTQADLLAKELNIPHISTGDIFRNIMAEDSERGREMLAIMKSGILVSDEITNKIVAERLKQPDCKNGFILDGFPRNLHQAEFLVEKKISIDHCILVDISDEEAIKRMSSRRVCPVCKASFNTITVKPKVDGVCDACKGKLIIRADDEPEAIKQRLKTYHELTAPVLEFYDNKKTLLKINGEQPIDKVFKDLVGKIMR